MAPIAIAVWHIIGVTPGGKFLLRPTGRTNRRHIPARWATGAAITDAWVNRCGLGNTFNAAGAAAAPEIGGGLPPIIIATGAGGAIASANPMSALRAVAGNIQRVPETMGTIAPA